MNFSDFLLVVVLTSHLLCVNLAAAGPLVAVWLEWRGARRYNEIDCDAARWLAAWSLGAALLGLALGVAALGVLGQLPADRLREAMSRVPARTWWLLASELAVYLGCLLGYLLLWKRWRSHRFWHRLLAVAAGTNLLYHFPPLFVAISIIGERPDLADRPIDHHLVSSLFFDPQAFSLTLHHWLAAVAVTGVALGGFHLRYLARGKSSFDSSGVAVLGGRLALAASLLQLPIGVWVLLRLPEGSRESLLGSDSVATASFIVALVAAMALLHQLAALSLGDASRRTIVAAMLLTALVVALMIGAQRQSRRSGLALTRIVGSHGNR